ncbi:MAG: cell envelope integrity protein CreD [Campylobacteraceae bacterium]|jgi:inner membrane protein|nr:cell envelope integrity protein CreD [Campylobacteraceae bacterium]
MKKAINKAILFKTIAIAVLILLMLIPLAFVESTIDDRGQYKNEAVSKIKTSWGSDIMLAAPILNIPYTYNEVETSTVDDKIVQKTVTKTAYAKYAPAELNANIDIKSQVRYIGIFKMPVFTADVTISGYFDEDKDIKGRLDESFISLEVSDLKGISEPILTWGANVQKFEPSLFGTPLSLPSSKQEISRDYYRSYSPYVTLKALNSKIDFKNKTNKFELKFAIKGSGSIEFIPLGKNSVFHVSSDWADPSFFGAFLPEDKNITDNGFNASWDINYLASSVPQKINGADLSSASFGVSFLIPVDNYRNAERAAKYGILFIALTFIVCFVFEIATRRPIHPVQYVLVGFAMVIFYTLLISISEFIDFSLAYVISAAAVVSLITLYAKFGIIKDLSAKSTALVVLSLLFLYGYLYMLLQLQDMALFYGSIGLFVMLGVIMYMTRNIEWYIEEN